MALISLTTLVIVMVIGQVCGQPEVSFEPPVAVKGQPFAMTCAYSEGKSDLELVKAFDGEELGDAMAYIDSGQISISYRSVARRVTEENRILDTTDTHTKFTLKFTGANCSEDAYAYYCRVGPDDTTKGTGKALGVIDNEAPVSLSNIERCLTDEGTCIQCNRDKPKQPFRNVGDEITLTCFKDISFPKQGSNTFVWSKRSSGRAWQDVQSNPVEDELEPSPRKDGECLQPITTRSDTVTYTVTKDDGPHLDIRCRVQLKLDDIGSASESEEKVYATEAITTVCVPNHPVIPNDEAEKKDKPETTPGGDSEVIVGFSLLQGPGLALLVTGILVPTVGGVAGGVFLYKRRHRAPPNPNADADYYYGGDERYQ